MIDRVDNRGAQPLAVTGDQSQPGVGAVHGALDGHLDQKLGIVSDGLAAPRRWIERASSHLFRLGGL
jgi:hypothetical protein